MRKSVMSNDNYGLIYRSLLADPCLTFPSHNIIMWVDFRGSRQKEHKHVWKAHRNGGILASQPGTRPDHWLNKLSDCHD